MDKLHTVKNMRKTPYLSKLAYRQLRTSGLQKGATDTQTRAMEEAIKILKQENPARFPEELDAKIRSHFPGSGRRRCHFLSCKWTKVVIGSISMTTSYILFN